MHIKNIRLWSASFALATLGFQACTSKDASQNASDPSAINATNPSSLNSTLSAIEGLLDTINTEDAASSSAKMGRNTLSLSDLTNAKFSPAGCRVKNEFERARRNVFNDGLSTICRVSAIKEAAGIELSDTYQVLKVTGVPLDDKDSSSGQTGTMLVRIKTEGDSKLMLDLCPVGPDGVGKQKQSWSAEAKENGVLVRVQNKDDHEERISSLSLEAYGTTESLTKLIMNTRWEDQYGKGSVDAKADKEENLIYVDGSFINSFTSEQGTQSADFEMCGYMSKGRGAGTEQGTFTYPAFTPMQPNTNTIALPTTSCGFQNVAAEGELPVFENIPPNEEGKCVRTVLPGEHSEAFKNFKLELDGEKIEFTAVDSGASADALIAKLSQCEIDTDPMVPETFSSTWTDCSTEGLTVTEVAFASASGFADCEEESNKEPVDCFQLEREAQEKQGAGNNH